MAGKREEEGVWLQSGLSLRVCLWRKEALFTTKESCHALSD